MRHWDERRYSTIDQARIYLGTPAEYQSVRKPFPVFSLVFSIGFGCRTWEGLLEVEGLEGLEELGLAEGAHDGRQELKVLGEQRRVLLTTEKVSEEWAARARGVWALVGRGWSVFGGRGV